MEKSKKNFKVIFLTAILIVIAVAGLVTTFLLNYNTFAPDKPIVLDDGKNIYISTSLNTNYKGYRFKFVDEKGTEIVVDSDENVVPADVLLENGIKIGIKYMVSTCYLALNEGNNSEFSEEAEWVCKAYLSATEIAINPQTNLLSWTSVEGADFYRVYYNDENGEVSFDTDKLYADLQTFKGGEKIIYVVAHSNNENYKPSAKSNVLDFNLVHYFSEFSSVSFNAQTKILTAENSELLSKLEIYLDQTNYSNIKFDVNAVANGYVYKIDLSLIYDGQTAIGISPANIDEFNKFVGNIKTIEIGQGQ